MKRRISLLLFLVLALILNACGGSSQSNKNEISENKEKEANQVQEVKKVKESEYSVTDVRGKTIKFEKTPERIATVDKPLPSIIYAIDGKTDKIVGCNPSSIKAFEESVLKNMYPQLANANTKWCSKDSVVNVEELLKLKPDVVFIYLNIEKEIEKMEAAGLKVVALKRAEFDSIKENIKIISEVLQKKERGDLLVEYMDKGINEVTSKLAEIKDEDKPKVIEFYSDMKIAIKTYDHWMKPSGAHNPAHELKGNFAEVDMEQMIVWNPDIIYLGNHSDLMPEDFIENKQEGRNWSTIKAVANKQVYKIPIGVYRWDPPGVETPLTVKWAAKIQYPQLFSDMDMEVELKNFFEYVYDYKLSDDEVATILRK